MQQLLVIILAFILFTPIKEVAAQTNSDVEEQGIYVLCKYDGQNVKIRWDPSNFDIYQKIKDHGVNVYRYTLRLDTGILNTQQIISSETIIGTNIKPLTSSELDSLDAPSDLKTVANELLYNYQIDTIPSDTVRLSDIKNRKDKEENYLMMTSLISVRDWQICKALGLGILDTSVQIGAMYRYIVQLQDTSLQSFVYNISIDQSSSSGSPTIRAKGLDKQIILSFNISGFQDKFQGYYIERREKNSSDSFQRIQNEPFISFEQRDKNLFQVYDSIPDNQTEYEYRIQGIDFFGDVGSYSNIVSVMGRPPALEAQPQIDTVYPVVNGVKVEFSFPDSMESKIQGFNVYNGNSVDGPFRIINDQVLSVQSREIVDDSINSVNHFYVEAIDENDYSLMSFSYLYQPPDSTPPELPTNITGEIEKTGKVKLSWDPSSSSDIYYYRVYFSFEKDSAYMDVSGDGAKRTHFHRNIDIKTLTKYLYVRLAAVDFRENISNLSEPIKLRIPDVIPPNKAVIKYLRPMEFGVAIDWSYSTSDDIAYHILERRKTNSGTWIKLLELPYGDESYYIPDIILDQDDQSLTDSVIGSQYKYIDTTIAELTEYEYRMIAVDSSSNESGSIPLRIKTPGIFSPGSIYSFTCNKVSLQVLNRQLFADQQGLLIDTTSSGSMYKQPYVHGVVLYWQYTNDPRTVERFIIYRARKDGMFSPIGSFPMIEDVDEYLYNLNDFGYTYNEWAGILSGISADFNHEKFYYPDFNIRFDVEYEYKIRAKLKDGGYSYMSDVNVCKGN